MLPTRNEAEKLLLWAGGLNPGKWVEHSEAVARAAEAIARKCGLDTHRAYVSGLLHDIGRFEGVTDLHHVCAGYELLRGKGYGEVAEISLSHSFPRPSLADYIGKNDCTDEETDFIASYLSNAVYNDYDRLVQLCDSMCSADGVCLIEVRVIDVIRRYGVKYLTQSKLEAIFELKGYFDRLCGMNIYDLFYDEIRDLSFR